VVLALLMVAIVAYLAWSGWRGAANRREAPWRALAYGLGAGLVAILGAVYAMPPMSPEMAQATTAAAWVLGALLVLGAGAYGYVAAERGQEINGAGSYAAVGAVAAGVVIKMGLSGAMGRGFGAPLHTYGLLLATAFLVASWIAAREAQRAFPEKIKVDGKLEPAGPIMRDHVLNLSFYILVAALIGSRVLFVITKWDEYRKNLWSVFSLEGGLVFYGGFIGAALTAVWYSRKHKLDFLRIADALIPSVAIGHTIGRLGCLSAGCCWGGIAKEGSKIAVRFPAAKNLPFGGFGTDSLAWSDQARDTRWVDSMGHAYDHMVAGAQQISQVAKATGYTLPVYPTQLMEATGELILFLGLLWLRRYKRFNGQILATWLMGYAMLRTTVEFFRGDALRGYLFRWPTDVDPLLLSTSQTVSLGIFATGVALWVLYGRKPREQAAVASPA
jgi:phosphatidylglycerol:prolipoprotein diacylglycerol transferase